MSDLSKTPYRQPIDQPVQGHLRRALGCRRRSGTSGLRGRCPGRVREQLATLDGVLVWVNPIRKGRNRANLDALLREVAARGVWVSAHPDVILKMGTKEVLHRSSAMSWGCDTALYRTAEAMRAELPMRLAGLG
jgi:hypothetical protein